MRYFRHLVHKQASPYSLLLIYLSAFFYALHYALPLYVDSSFLSGLVSPDRVGLVFTVSNIAAMLFIANVPKILHGLGSRRTFVLFALLEFFSLAALSLFASSILLLASFVLHMMFLNAVFFSLDLILESHSENEKTGRIRGSFFTILNIAVLFGPLLAGFLVVNGNFGDIYLYAAATLLPAAYLLGVMLPEYREPKYRTITFGASLQVIWKEKHLFAIFASYFLLQFFYAWMIIYMPIYLHEHVGFDFTEILGIIFPIMLLPFVLFDFVFGLFADLKDTRGEKKGLIWGFVIMGFFTALLPFVEVQSIFVWALALFATRIGAALVEIMCETYFYKHVSSKDAEIVSDWRNVAPAAFIVAPALATVILALPFLSLQHLFIILGSLMFSGCWYARDLR
ncbi:MFS transporter [bacterium]|nr:MFS transporter [bacterium]